MKKWKIGLGGFIAFVLMLTVILPAAPVRVYGAVPKLDTIRVALFLSTAKGQLSITSEATLSSADVLQVGSRRADGTVPWFTVQPGITLKSALNQYRVLLLESSAKDAAEALAAQLKSKGYMPVTILEEKLGQTVYRVYASGYASQSEARTALTMIAADPDIQPLARGFNAAVAGPLTWNAGDYATEAEAEKAASALRAKGLPAYKAVYEGAAGKPIWSAWLGEAADEQSLAALKTEATRLVSGLQLKAVPEATTYAVIRSAPKGGVVTVLLSAQQGRVWVSSAGQAGIKVAERFERLYRGAIELSGSNGRLAVINELPFEPYLYSVVGSELDESWPSEVLKAQAVAARTYALAQGMKYGIAHVSDTTYDQAYRGISREFSGAVKAVEATAGEVLMDKDGLITPFYHSNAGNMTAAPTEVWGRSLSYLKSVPSPDDGAQKGKLDWYRIVLEDGTTGYIRSDYAKDSGTRNEAGFAIMTATETGVNIRKAPYVDNDTNGAIAQVKAGDRFVKLGAEKESTPYRWVRGPYPAAEVLAKLKSAIPALSITSLDRLEISKRSTPSGRVTEIRANGQPITVAQADSYRTVLGGLPSIRFDIEQTSALTVIGAGGKSRAVNEGDNIYALYTDKAQGAVSLRADEYVVLGANTETSLKTREASYRFIGLGWGHGLGMSQWGARGLSELGYDYRKILQYYYHGTTLTKG
ncbi:SpoIID/LytB domain-containing protein [Paenibacillus turpanensis]|uniref:SpoIID/LytB domain-containing protein n=1 Tax=Paenibacillus turpanensis TaxID=2689078 RepID=UPI001FB664F8|nr:SpoIID/LytB domain-containing protein [Paenibacillus turpanensis]